MALDIHASKIVNTVTFKVDSNALKQAKDSIKKIKDFAEGLQPQLNMKKFKNQMRDMENQARRMQTAVNNATEKAQRQGQQGPKQGAGRPRANDEQKEIQRAIRREELGRLRMENFSHRASQYTKVGSDDLEHSRKIISQTVELYQREEVSLARLNQVLAHQLDSLRRIHREKNAEIEDTIRGRRREKRELEAIANQQRRMIAQEEKARAREAQRSADQARRERDNRHSRIGEGIMGLNPQMVTAGLLGAAAYEGGARVLESLNSNAERINLISRGAENVQTNANTVMAMTAWGQQNGVDSANIIKSIDNIKDVRERLGNSVLYTKYDEDDKKYKGGDSGIADIMNQFGWNIDDIKQFQNNPFDFIQATVNEGERRGMNSAQIGRLMENLGDDLMHYQRMFSHNGEEYDKTVRKLIDSGAALTQEQINSAQEYTRIAVELGMVNQAMGSNFLQGFVEAFGGIGELQKNTKEFTEAARWLGHETGELATHLGELIVSVKDTYKGLTDWYNNSFFARGTSAEDKAIVSGQLDINKTPYTNPDNPLDHADPNVQANASASFDRFINWVQGIPSRMSGGEYGSAWAAKPLDPTAIPSRSAAPLQVTNVVQVPDNAIKVNVIPDGYGFSNYLRTEVGSQLTGFSQGLTLQMSSAQSSTGN